MVWIYLFLVALFIRPQDWPGSPVYGLPVNYIVMIGGVITGIYLYSQQKRNIKVPMNVLVALFVSLAFISNAANGRVDAGVAQFILLFKRALVYFMIVLILDTPQKVKNILILSILMGVILVFQGMYQNVHGVGWALQGLNGNINLTDQSSLYCFEQFGTRIFWIGDWDGPNVLSIVFLVGIPFCLEYLFGKGTGLVPRIVLLACLALLCYGIYLTNSRGGFLALVGMLALFMFLRFGKKALPAMVIVCAVFFYFLAPARMTTVSSNESSARERTWLWEQGLNMTRAHPVFGIGKGQFANNAALVAHNNFVGNMAETGLPGLYIYCALVYLSLKSMYLVNRMLEKANEKNEYYHLSRILLVTLAGFYLTTFFIVMEMEILYLLWGLTTAVFVLSRQRYKELSLKFEPWDQRLVASMCVGIIFLVWMIAVKELI